VPGHRDGRVRGVPVHGRRIVRRLGAARVRRPVHGVVLAGRGHRPVRAPRRNVPGQRQIQSRLLSVRRLVVRFVLHQQTVFTRRRHRWRLRHVPPVLRHQPVVGPLRLRVPVRDERHGPSHHPRHTRRFQTALLPIAQHHPGTVTKTVKGTAIRIPGQTRSHRRSSNEENTTEYTRVQSSCI